MINLIQKDSSGVNKFFYCSFFSSPIIIFLSFFICDNSVKNNHFFILCNALFFSIFSSYLLGVTIFKIIENEKIIRTRFLVIKNYRGIKFTIVFSLISILIILFVSRNGFHDYRSYLTQWSIINQGLDPYIGTSNAYLPIHNIFAPLARINKSLPKIIFLLVFMIPMYFSSILPLNLKRDTNNITNLQLFLIFAFSPFCIITTILYGQNDTLVSGLIVLSLFISISKNTRINSLISAVSLAFATMVKVYPIFIAPLFVWRKRRTDVTFFASYFLSITLILLTSISIWGRSTIIPIIFSAARKSKHLSFFNFFRQIVGINLDTYSVFSMAAVILIALFFIYKYKIDLLPSVLIILAFALSFYKVGHQQFFLFFFAVSPMTIRYIYDKKLTEYKRLFFSFIVWICFLNSYQVFYILTCKISKGFDFAFYSRGYAPLVYILSSTFMLIELTKLLKNYPKSLSSDT